MQPWMHAPCGLSCPCLGACRCLGEVQQCAEHAPEAFIECAPGKVLRLAVFGLQQECEAALFLVKGLKLGPGLMCALQQL